MLLMTPLACILTGVSCMAANDVGDAGVDGEELGLPLLDELVVDAVICHQLHHNGVDPVHGRDQLLGPELDLHHALGLEDASLPGRVSVALDLVRVDLRVDDDPGSATKLASRRDVHEHRMAVGRGGSRR